MHRGRVRTTTPGEAFIAIFLPGSDAGLIYQPYPPARLICQLIWASIHVMTKSTISKREWQAWRGFRRMAETVSGRIAQEITSATGLSKADFVILMQFNRSGEDRVRQRELQVFLEWDKTRLSHQLTRMAGRGLIKRESGDSSGVTICITPEGRRLFAVAKPPYLKSLHENFLDHLTADEVDALARITSKLRNALLGDEPPAPDSLQPPGEGGDESDRDGMSVEDMVL